jgi:ABC-type antimicrobial peptide transport system permease subunit
LDLPNLSDKFGFALIKAVEEEFQIKFVKSVEGIIVQNVNKNSIPSTHVLTQVGHQLHQTLMTNIRLFAKNADVRTLSRKKILKKRLKHVKINIVIHEFVFSIEHYGQ